jgi:hypothetical protein
MELGLTNIMAYLYDCDDYCRRFPEPLIAVERDPKPITGLTVEEFLRRFPEFKVLLQDSDLSEDFIFDIITEAKVDIELGRWSDMIALQSVYLLAAHTLQTRFEQQAKTASTAVSASQGKGDKATSSNTNTMVNEDLASTTYGKRLIRLQAQSRSNGGIVV